MSPRAQPPRGLKGEKIAVFDRFLNVDNILESSSILYKSANHIFSKIYFSTIYFILLYVYFHKLKKTKHVWCIITYTYQYQNIFYLAFQHEFSCYGKIEISKHFNMLEGLPTYYDTMVDTLASAAKRQTLTNTHNKAIIIVI